MKINKKITKLKESLARSPDQTHLHSRLDDLNLQIQDEVLRLADRWQTRSKTNWIEKGKKLTKYFFSKYKARTGSSALKNISIQTGQPQSNDNQSLHYIREQYSKFYRKEEIDQDLAELLTRSLATVS